MAQSPSLSLTLSLSLSTERVQHNLTITHTTFIEKRTNIWAHNELQIKVEKTCIDIDKHGTIFHFLSFKSDHHIYYLISQECE